MEHSSIAATGTGDTEGSRNSSHVTLGLDEGFGWRVAATIYGVAAPIVFFISALGALPIRPGLHSAFGVFILGAWVFCPIWIVFMRRRVAENWLCLPILMGFGIIWAVVWFVEAAAVASIAPLFIFPTVAAAYVLHLRKAAPYAIVGVASVSLSVLVDGSGANQLTSLTTGLTVLTVATATVMALQARQRALAARYLKLALCDPLTGIANVRALRAHLAQVLAHGGPEMTLFMADLDNFKQVNDLHSHAVGDEVLRAVASALADVVRPGDLVCRKGGDEFAVAARLGDDQEQIRLFESKLASAIVSARTTVCPGVESRASIGYTRQVAGDTPDSIVARANDALHLAKVRAHRRRRAGRVAPIALDRRAKGESVSSASGPPHAANVRTGPMRRILRGSDACVSSHSRPGHGDRPAARLLSWRIGVTGFAVTPIVSIAVGVSGGNPEMQSPLAVAVGVASVASAFLLVWLGGRVSDTVIGHGSLALSLVLLSCFLVVAPASRLALVDYLLLPALVSFLFLPGRWSSVYVAASAVLYAGFSFSQDYAYPAAKSAIAMLVLAVLGVLFVTARKTSDAYREKIFELSKTDELTGLANRRTLEQHLANTAAPLADGQELVVVMIDLDDFKSVNDTYSHTTGDAVLHAVAAAITSAVRTEDLVARRGGDEFVVVMRREAGSSVDVVVNRIATLIERERSSVCPDLTPSASFGVVKLGAGSPIEDPLAEADEQLHSERARRGYVSSRDESAQLRDRTARG